MPARAAVPSRHATPSNLAVIGGGLVGLATALELQRLRPDLRITVLDKEPEVGRHQSGHNSGVLHCGLYYRPGSLKARLAVRGIRRMIAFCEEHDIAHDICGKLVVAVDAAERERLRGLEARGRENGLRGLRWLEGDALREVEPHAGGIAALHVPEEGIVDYPAVALAMRRLLEARGATIRTGAEAVGIADRAGAWRISLGSGDVVEAAFVVGCAGLHADRVAAMAGVPADIRILPFRGEYYELAPARRHLVRNLIYPVPDPRFPFLGVHFTRLVHGGVEAGPNAVLALAREGYRWTDVSPRDLADALTYRGLWAFLARNARPAFAEVRRSFSARLFAAALQRLVPEITPADLEPGGSGVRAQAVRADGALVEDFAFAEGPRALFVLNAPSPAATASLAIGEHLGQRILPRL